MDEELISTEDQRLLDLLVDGELDDVRRRELLLRLERAPQGWRRCALAFLEAQAWRREAKAVVSEPPTAIERAAVQPASVASRAWIRPALYIPTAMAAGFVLTFVLLKNWNGGEIASISIPPGGGVQIVESVPVDAGRDPHGQNLRLVVDGTAGERQRTVEVPLLDVQSMHEALFGSGVQSLPPDFVRLLEQSGHQVVRERRLVPIDLRDGRRVVVPMDQVDIRPVGNRGYQ